MEQHIKKLIEASHTKDVVVPECKNGPSQGRSHSRLDAWVLKRTYSPFTTIGYEIKCSRGDFLRDAKWTSYLKLCHEFYFVCPHGMIQPEELPEYVGLKWVAKTGTRLFTKRKSAWRDIVVPRDLLIYVLMSRAAIDCHHKTSELHGADYWRDWLQRKRDSKKLGRKVRGRVAEIASAIARENEQLRDKMKGYDAIRARIKELGFSEGDHVSEWSVNRKIQKLDVTINGPGKMRALAQQLEAGADYLEQLGRDGVK